MADPESVQETVRTLTYEVTALRRELRVYLTMMMVFQSAQVMGELSSEEWSRRLDGIQKILNKAMEGIGK